MSKKRLRKFPKSDLIMQMFSRCWRIFNQGFQTWGVILLSLCLFVCGGCQVQTPTEPGVINLTLWHGINPPPNRDVFQKLVNGFNQTHPQINVNAYYIGQPDQQMPKILTAVVGNASPDILWYSPKLQVNWLNWMQFTR
jgi:multiple sugar transport system substrate-binding protein